MKSIRSIVANRETVTVDSMTSVFDAARVMSTRHIGAVTIPAGFVDVNLDGTKVTGPIAGLTDLKIDFGTKTSQLSAMQMIFIARESSFLLLTRQVTAVTA